MTGKSEFSLLEQDSDDPSIFISGPANSLAAITAKALKHGYGGMAALSGIPGTLGGAFKMNAGAMGKCLSDFVVDFTTVDLRTGECFIQNKNDLVWEYRHSGLSDTRILVQ